MHHCFTELSIYYEDLSSSKDTLQCGQYAEYCHDQGFCMLDLKITYQVYRAKWKNQIAYQYHAIDC